MPSKGATNNPNGRPVGVPNKATVNAREAVASFVEGNVERLNGWLDSIANGVPDENNPGKWLQPPSPKDAYNCFMDVVEYHIPKLSRVDQQFLDKEGKPADASVAIRYID